MASVLQDLRYALRIARQNPGSTLAAFIALALGIGAVTAMFSVVNGVLVRPLPVEDPDRVVRVFESEARMARDTVSMEDFLDWRRDLKSFQSLALFQIGRAHV